MISRRREYLSSSALTLDPLYDILLSKLNHFLIRIMVHWNLPSLTLVLIKKFVGLERLKCIAKLPLMFKDNVRRDNPGFLKHVKLDRFTLFFVVILFCNFLLFPYLQSILLRLLSCYLISR